MKTKERLQEAQLWIIGTPDGRQSYDSEEQDTSTVIIHQKEMSDYIQDPIQHRDVWALEMDMDGSCGISEFQGQGGESLKSPQDQVTQDRREMAEVARRATDERVDPVSIAAAPKSGLKSSQTQTSKQKEYCNSQDLGMFHYRAFLFRKPSL